MTRPNDKDKIRDHYDRASPCYYSLWGEHVHHGYWIRGNETKEQAQVQLIEHLAEAAELVPGSRILDVGCGFGGSSSTSPNATTPQRRASRSRPFRSKWPAKLPPGSLFTPTRLRSQSRIAIVPPGFNNFAAEAKKVRPPRNAK